MPTRQKLIRFAGTFTVIILMILCLSGVTSFAKQNVVRVPEDQPNIQAAVDACAPGDQIRVGPGSWVGATIDKHVHLIGEGGATIIGGASSPDLAGVLRIGFLLPDASANGTTIRHFTFDGQGVSNSNYNPLSFAIFAREANDVIVEHNTILGTVQAITNTEGSGWSVSHNNIEGLTLFACEMGGFCGGGVGIVFQDRVPLPDLRATDNSATHNVITGTVPDAFDVFSMAGIFALGEDGTVIKNNHITIPDNPTADSAGVGIELSDVCCGVGAQFKTTINSVIVRNDCRDSEIGLLIPKDLFGGTGNTDGTLIRGNFGLNSINEVDVAVTNRSIHTLQEFP